MEVESHLADNHGNNKTLKDTQQTDQWQNFEKCNTTGQFYLKYGRMFQSALNLYLIGHTLDHSSLVHGFFVNLQTEKRNKCNIY